ncbi:MAG: hypothetical protein NC453_30615 [Muribaculum sp.]|nr:hypothetical protein [Muribaculum sp.]
MQIKKTTWKELIETKDYTIVETESCSLEGIVEFVVKKICLHHQKSLPENISEEIEELIKEKQRLLSTSKFFVARDKEVQLIGCIWLHRWNHTSDLPISKFGISVEEVFPKEEYPNIWHVGRFAIKSQISKDAIVILKTLMICAIAPIVNTHSSIMLAEIDAKLIRSLKLMDIGVTPIGKPLYYIGSKTLPISSTASDLINYYERHRNLLLMRHYIEANQTTFA